MSESMESMSARIDQQQLAQQLVESARSEGVELVGPDGMLTGNRSTPPRPRPPRPSGAPSSTSSPNSLAAGRRVRANNTLSSREAGGAERTIVHLGHDPVVSCEDSDALPLVIEFSGR